MNHKTSWHQEIRRTVFVLIAVISILGLIGVSYVTLTERKSRQIQVLANDFYLASNLHYSKAMEELRKIEGDLLLELSVAPESQQRVGLQNQEQSHAVSFFIIQKAINDALVLQNATNDRQLETLSALLGQRLATFEERGQDYLVGPGLASRQTLLDAQALIVTLRQTMSLHSILRDELLIEFDSYTQRQLVTFLTLLAILILSGVFISRRGLRAIQSTIGERKLLESELLDHRENLEKIVENRTLQLNTSREEAEAAARALGASEARFKQAARIAHLGHWLVDEKQGILLEVSEEYARIHGYTTDEYLQRYRKLTDDFLLVHPEDRAKVHQLYDERYEGQHEFRIFHRDGSERHVIESIKTQYDEAGVPRFSAGSLQDITHLKQAELRLQSALEAANNADLAKGQFLANMSHEIRTPMNAIVGLTHLILQSPLPSEQKKRLLKISDSTKHLLAIINDILDISKIEAGKVLLEYTDFQLDAVFDQVLSLVNEQVRAKGLDVEFHLNHISTWFKGDQTRLCQMLLNYVSNAIKFTKRGKISLGARTLEKRNGQFLIRFEVKDTGIGIEPENLSTLFGAFEQADASTTRKYGGSGLGLTICKHLAELMGGEVGVKSEPGVGSTFWFTVELSQGIPFKAITKPTPSPDTATNLHERFNDARVLLVEDNLINREVALELLQGFGLVIETAEDGNEALQMVIKRHYDLVLMDMQMPVMDGLEATRAIRAVHAAESREKLLPILAMTANIFEEDREACVAAGMNDFVAKPVDPDNLYSTIMKWLPGSNP